MAELLVYFGVASPQFTPRIVYAPGHLVIEGIGIDMVTEPQRCLHISREELKFLADRMGAMLDCAARKDRTQAIFHIESMIRTIKKAADPNGEKTTQISNGRGLTVLETATHNCLVTKRDHSMRIYHLRFTLHTASKDEAALREMVSILQEHYNDLMKDDPGAAIHRLRRAIQTLAEQDGI